MRKGMLSLISCLLLLLLCMQTAVRAVEAPSFAFELLLTDTEGNIIHNRADLQAGDEVVVSIVLRRTDDSSDYTASGLELVMVSKGMKAGERLEVPDFIQVSTTTQKIAGTLTRAFRYYDMNGVGRVLPNSLTVFTASYTVTNPSILDLTLSTRSIYIGTTEYMPSGSPDRDVNGDKNLSLQDVSLLFRIVSKQETRYSILTNSGDMDGNNVLNLHDVALLYQEYQRENS